MLWHHHEFSNSVILDLHGATTEKTIDASIEKTHSVFCKIFNLLKSKLLQLPKKKDVTEKNLIHKVALKSKQSIKGTKYSPDNRFSIKH